MREEGMRGRNGGGEKDGGRKGRGVGGIIKGIRQEKESEMSRGRG